MPLILCTREVRSHLDVVKGIGKAHSKLVPDSHVLAAGARAAASTSLPTAARVATGATLAGIRGPQRWMDNGARNLALSGIDDETINKLRSTGKGQQTLMEAGDLSFGSRRLAAITNGLLREKQQK